MQYSRCVACAKIYEVIRTEAGPNRARPHTLERQAFPMAKEFFGTDGIRGVPGTPPLDDATLYATGRSLGVYLKREHGAAHVLIGLRSEERRVGKVCRGWWWWK